MPPGSVRLFFIVPSFHSTGFLYVWYGHVAFTGQIGVGNHLSLFGNRKVLALEDGQETTCLPLIPVKCLGELHGRRRCHFNGLPDRFRERGVSSWLDGRCSHLRQSARESAQ